MTTMVKFVVVLGVFQRPALYAKSGVIYGIICDTLGVLMAIECNNYLVICMKYMP